MGNNHKIYQARIWNKCFLADDKEVGGDAGMGDQAVDIEGEDKRTCQYVRGGALPFTWWWGHTEI